MATPIRFAQLNPFRMAPAVDLTPDLYHTRTFDFVPQWANRQPGEVKTVYYEPVERGDPFRYEASYVVAGTQSVSLVVIDCDGHQVYEFEDTRAAFVPGLLDEGARSLVTVLWRAADWSFLPEDGIYYLKTIVTSDDDGAITEYLADPIDLRDRHEGTIMIEYRNSRNTQYTFFEQLPVLFRKRVYGAIRDFDPASLTTVFEGENGRLVQLDSQPFRRWTLYAGGNGDGISESTLEILNRILTLDSVYIDRIAYVKDDGASWEQYKTDRVPLIGASIALREASPNTGGSFGGSDLALWTLPGTYPYALSGIAVTDAAGAVITIDHGPVVIKGATEQSAYIDGLAAKIASADALGAITTVGGVVYLSTGIGQRYSRALVEVYTDSFGINYLTSSAQSVYFEATSRLLIVDWGDGSGLVKTDAVLSDTRIEHLYTVAGAKSARIYYRPGYIQDFRVTRAVLGNSTQPIVSFSGTFPALSFFSLDSTTLTAFDTSLLAPSANTLVTLQLINNTNLSTLTTPFPVFKLLESMQLYANALNANQVSGALNAVLNTVQANKIYNGNFNAGGQTPPATAYTPKALATKATLENSYYWSVTL